MGSIIDNAHDQQQEATEQHQAQAQAVAIFDNLRSRLRSAGAAFAAGEQRPLDVSWAALRNKV